MNEYLRNARAARWRRLQLLGLLILVYFLGIIVGGYSAVWFYQLKLERERPPEPRREGPALVVPTSFGGCSWVNDEGTRVPCAILGVRG